MPNGELRGQVMPADVQLISGHEQRRWRVSSQGQSLAAPGAEEPSSEAASVAGLYGEQTEHPGQPPIARAAASCTSLPSKLTDHHRARRKWQIRGTMREQNARAQDGCVAESPRPAIGATADGPLGHEARPTLSGSCFSTPTEIAAAKIDIATGYGDTNLDVAVTEPGTLGSRLSTGEAATCATRTLEDSAVFAWDDWLFRGCAQSVLSDISAVTTTTATADIATGYGNGASSLEAKLEQGPGATVAARPSTTSAEAWGEEESNAQGTPVAPSDGLPDQPAESDMVASAKQEYVDSTAEPGVLEEPVVVEGEPEKMNACGRGLFDACSPQKPARSRELPVMERQTKIRERQLTTTEDDILDSPRPVLGAAAAWLFGREVEQTVLSGSTAVSTSSTGANESATSNGTAIFEVGPFRQPGSAAVANPSLADIDICDANTGVKEQGCSHSRLPSAKWLSPLADEVSKQDATAGAEEPNFSHKEQAGAVFLSPLASAAFLKPPTDKILNEDVRVAAFIAERQGHIEPKQIDPSLSTWMWLGGGLFGECLPERNAKSQGMPRRMWASTSVWDARAPKVFSFGSPGPDCGAAAAWLSSPSGDPLPSEPPISTSPADLYGVPPPKDDNVQLEEDNSCTPRAQDSPLDTELQWPSPQASTSSLLWLRPPAPPDESTLTHDELLAPSRRPSEEHERLGHRRLQAPATPAEGAGPSVH